MAGIASDLYVVERGKTSVVKVEGSAGGDLHVAQGLPEYASLAALGGGYQGISTAGVAALTARPTTTSLLTLWNGEPDNGLAYLLDTVFCHQLVSGSAEARFGLWLCIHPTGMSEPTDDITTKNSYSGKRGYGGRAFLDVGATVVDDGWFPVGPSVDVEPTGVLPGAQMWVELKGRYILPPSAGASLHVVASTVNEDFTVGFGWFEVPKSALAV